MRRKPVTPLSFETLHELSTKQLLARLKQLQQCETSSVFSDVGEQPNPSGMLFKDTVEWRAAYEQVKTMLAQREHVLRGAEVVERRKQRAKLAHTTERRAGRQKR
jgi:hypothetical protein